MICWNCQWEQIPETEKEYPKFCDLKCAVSFVEELRQQLAQREAEVAALSKASAEFLQFTILSSVEGVIDYRNHTIKRENLIKALDDLQPTAEAFKAKVWNEALREALKHQRELEGPLYSWDPSVYVEDIEKLLKPEIEVV